MRVRKVLPSFNTGIVSSKLTARVDYEKYHAGLERCDNYIVLPQGPVVRRPGTVYVAETKFGSSATSLKKSRLVKFQFNTTDAYALEFGDYYIRFYKDKARLGAPTEVATPYSEDDIWDLKFEQSFDVMYIVSPNHWPRKLSRTSDTAWTLKVINFDPPPSYVADTDLEVACVAGSTGDASKQGTEDVEFDSAVDGVFVSADVGRAIIYGASRAIITKIKNPTSMHVCNLTDDIVEATIMDSWDTNGVTMAAHGWYLTGSPVAAINCSDNAPRGKKVNVLASDNDATPQTVTLANAAGVITCTYTAHGLANNDWVLISGAENGYYNGIFKIANVTANTFDYTAKSDPNGAAGGSPKCLQGYSTFRAADVGKYIKTNGGVLRIVKHVTPHLVKAEILSALSNKNTDYAGQWSLEVGSFGVKDFESAKSPVSPNGIVRTDNTITVDFAAAHGYSVGDHVKIEGADQSGYNHVFRIIDNAPGADNTKFTAHITATPPTPATGTITCRKGNPSFPRAVCLYQNRLCLAGTQEQPNNVWGSKTGEYENFAIGTNDSSAIDYSLTVSNPILWLAVAKKLTVGTYGEELVVGAEDDKALTSTNVRVLKQTTHGSSEVMPLVIGHKVLFVQKSGNKLREFTYDYSSDNYIAEDLTSIADDITSPIFLGNPSWLSSGIVDMTYQQEPHSIVWGVRTDGILLGLTYDKLNNVYAWHKHHTGYINGTAYGWFESVLSIPAAGRDRVWVIVKRTIDGVTKRYVEYFEDDQWVSADGWGWPQVFTDCAKIYSGASTSTITTLDHLDGKVVRVIGNGVLLGNETVPTTVPYTITIDTNCTRVEVGLGYESHGLTVRPEVQLPSGTSQGFKKRWAQLVARLYETSAGYINEEPMEYHVVSGVKIPFTGDYIVKNLGYDAGGRICFRQPDPLPFTLLGFSGILEID